MAKRHMKRGSTFLIVRQMQIKTPRKYHLTLDRLAIIKKPTKNKCWGGCREKATLVHCWLKSKLVQSTWRTVWRFLKQLQTELPYDPAIPLMDICQENMKTLVWEDTCIPMFIAALFIIAKIWKQCKCPSPAKQDKDNVVYTHTHTDTHTDTDTDTDTHTHTHTHHNGILIKYKKESNHAKWNNVDRYEVC